MSDEPYPSARALLARYGLAAKKSWGQNFLTDRRVPERIADALGAGEGDVAVEIGAGLGHLTEALWRRGAHVVAVERDRDMATVLRGELGGRSRVELVEANALELDLGAIAARFGAPVFVAGNLPYHLSSQILVRMLSARRHVRECVLMLQRELGERLVSPPGSRAYGALSVMVQAHCDARALFVVSPGAFLPRPKVHSVVVRFEPRAGDASPEDERAFRWAVNAAFAQRRKTLRNALSQALVHGARGELAVGPVDAPGALAEHATEVSAIVDRALANAAIDGRARAETLDVAAYARLSHALSLELRARGALG